jgi:coenzyme A diphosphatase NUDT7
MGNALYSLLIAFIAITNDNFSSGLSTIMTTTMTETVAGGGRCRSTSAIIERLRKIGMEKKESSYHSTLRRASVLVPLFERSTAAAADDNDDDDGIHVLLTRRPSTMKSHGGEVCFPGGKMDDEDDGDDVRTALRESYEEIGLHPLNVHILSRMDTIESKHSLCVTPIIGVVKPSELAEPINLTLNTDEVEKAFDVPLRHFCDSMNNCVSAEEVMWRGEKFTLRTYNYDDVENDNNRFVIWGLTAHILWLVARIVYDEEHHTEHAIIK